MLVPPLRVATPRVTRVDLDDLQMDTARSRAAAYAAASDRILVRACLLELTVAEREVLELCLFHGWSTEEIGRYLGESQVEVTARIAEHVQRLEHRHGIVSTEAAAPATSEPAQPDSWPTAHTA
jgi:DNA-directed RNA polymerase specialized sigma24 family protein